ncbi:MAG: heme-binding protein, partial [Planctomycetes bacterium]|nr:heme-binding protein [Planctomycetota bacterium]
ARQGDKELQGTVLAALAGLDYAKLSRSQQLDLLRTYQLVFIRMGKPDQETADALAKRLDPHYPAASDGLNRELVTLLAYLNSPTVIDKTLAMMEKQNKQSSEDIAELLARNAGYGRTIAKMLANTPEIQKIHYAFALRTMRYGWTLEQRKKYFAWMNGAKGAAAGTATGASSTISARKPWPIFPRPRRRPWPPRPLRRPSTSRRCPSPRDRARPGPPRNWPP